jgi:hypothetical protein
MMIDCAHEFHGADREGFEDMMNSYSSLQLEDKVPAI